MLGRVFLRTEIWVLVLILGFMGCTPGPGGTWDTAAPVDATVLDVTDDTTPPIEDISTVDTGSDEGSSDLGPADEGTTDLGAPDVVVADQGVFDAGDVESDQGPVALQPCEPALTINPAEVWTNPYSLYTFGANGGIGAYQYRMQDPLSGSIMNTVAGSVLVGPVSGISEVVVVEDAGCEGSASAVFHVVPDLTLEPLVVTCAPNDSFPLSVGGGTGEYSFEVLDMESGGTISKAGFYTSGSNAGIDKVKAYDVLTGQEIVAAITVTKGVSLGVQPPEAFVPVGHKLEVKTEGGSGFYTYDTDSDFITVVDGVITVNGAVDAFVTVSDAYTSASSQILVHGIESQQFDAAPLGISASDGMVLSPGDIDGDGYSDAILSDPRVSAGAMNGGVVHVYKGGPSGLEATPVRSYIGQERKENLGTSLSAVDINQDGLIDLVIGSPWADFGFGDNGRVDIYLGVEGGFFSGIPSQTLAGGWWSDGFGMAVTVCDFSGDGWPDLAVGASSAEDRDADPVRSGQGAVYIYIGGPNGLSSEPSQILYGKRPMESSTWQNEANMQLGSNLASGDMDGDQRCELVVSSKIRHPDTDKPNGSVSVYRGKSPGAFFPGGVEVVPAKMWTDAGSMSLYFGWHLSMGDVTNDGLADVFISHPGYMANGEATSKSRGAAFLISGSDLEPGVASGMDDIRISGAWMHRSYDGVSDWDSSGWRGHFGDMDGDGLTDLIIVDLADEIADPEFAPELFNAWSNSGVLSLYKGLEGQLPEMTPSGLMIGLEAQDYIADAAVLSDMNGDGAHELVFFASSKDYVGRDTGLPYFVFGGIEVKPEVTDLAGNYHVLDFPMEVSGHFFGQSLSFISDRNGDGKPELVVGAPEDSVPSATSWGNSHGSVHIYLSLGDGYESMPTQSLFAYQGHKPGFRYGYALRDLGDFNGDGIDDLGILARYQTLESRGTYASWGFWGEEFVDTNGNGVFDAGIDSFTDSNSNGTHEPGFYSCAGSSSSGGVGALLVHLGVADEDDLFEAEPTFVFVHPKYYGTMVFLSESLDINGDGYKDALVGSDRWSRDTIDVEGNIVSSVNAAGGVKVFWGRPVPAPGETHLFCDGVDVFFGVNSNDGVGRVTAMGDLNGDSCDDFAFAGHTVDGENSNQGMVWVGLGWGGGDCPSESTLVALAPHVNNENAGGWIDGGKDVDGDDVPDLLVGATGLRVDNVAVGGAYLVPGSYLNTLAFEVNPDPTVLKPSMSLSPPNSSVLLQVNGFTPGGLAGRSVSLVEDLGGGQSAIAIGAPLSSLSGWVQSGGVAIHRYVEGVGLEAIPSIVVGGESERAGGRVGEALDSFTTASGSVFAVGGFFGSGIGVDSGSAYAFRMYFEAEEVVPVLPVPVGAGE